MKEIWNAILKFILGKTNLDEKISEKAQKVNEQIQKVGEMDDDLPIKKGKKK
jgi:hypothetical protein